MSALRLQLYHTDHGFVTALTIKKARKWMRLLIVDGGRLRIIRCLASEESYMSPLSTNDRKAKASLRRLARKRGTSRAIRAVIADIQ